MLPPSMQNNARELLGSEGIVDVLMVHWIEGVTDWIPSARGEAARIEALEPGWSKRNNFLLLRPDVFEHVGRLLDFSDMGIFDKLSGNLDRCHTHIPLDGYGKSQRDNTVAMFVGFLVKQQCANVHVVASTRSGLMPKRGNSQGDGGDGSVGDEAEAMIWIDVDETFYPASIYERKFRPTMGSSCVFRAATAQVRARGDIVRADAPIYSLSF